MGQQVLPRRSDRLRGRGNALKAIRNARGCSIPQALDVFADRYELLRRTRPNDFTLSPEEHGRGFYS